MVLQHNQPESRFLSLPSELIEHTLVSASILGLPEAIAATAQTCRDMRTLVYGASDQHLWREIYLGAFDDPRPGFRIDRQVSAPSPSQSRPSLDDIDFDWGAEFRQRVWAANYFARSAEKIASDLLHNSMQTLTLNANALEALLSAIYTAAPFPPTIIRLVPSPHSNADAYISPQSYPIFPPPPSAFIQEGSSDKSGLHPTSSWSSRNIEWVQATLAHGLPPSLNMALAGIPQFGSPRTVWTTHMETKVMRALGKLTACLGFHPITYPEETEVMVPSSAIAVTLPFRSPEPDEGDGPEVDHVDIHSDEDESEDEDGDENEDEAEPPPSEPEPAPETREEGVQTTLEPAFLPLDMSQAAQDARARRLGRMRVYNMRYLSRDRHWGPFLPPPELELNPSSSNFPDQLFAPHGGGHLHDDQGETRTATEIVAAPGPDQLRADWAYLGAVRVVVETNLRESVGADGLGGLVWPEGLRRESAPMGAQDDESLAAPFAMPRSVNKGKGKQKRSYLEEVEGWDWAGVDGIWRRCVCWMDYRDLIREY